MPRFLGQRVQLKTQLQGLAPATDRVRITATSRAIQYNIDAHDIARGLLTGFLGAQVRVSGAVWPPRIGPSGEPLGRLGLSSIGDLVVLEQGVLAGGARRVLTTVDEVRRLDPRDAALGHQIKVRASVTLVDLPWNILMIQDATAGIYVFASQLEHDLPPCRPGDIVEVEGESGPGEFAPMIVARRLAVVGHADLPRARADHARAPPRRARGQPAGRVRRRRPRHHPRRSGAPGHRAVARQPPLRHAGPVVRQPADPRGARRRRRDSRDGGRRVALQHAAPDHRRAAVRADRVADPHRSRRPQGHRRAADPHHVARARVRRVRAAGPPDADQGHRAGRPPQRDLPARRSRRPRGAPARAGDARPGRRRRGRRLPAAGRLRADARGRGGEARRPRRAARGAPAAGQGFC